MTDAEQPLADAAAFFALFVRSPWNACHVRTREIEIFIARDRASANPMIGAEAAPAEVVAPAATLRAPHLGTLVSLAALGAELAPGQSYARLDLLGETIELMAPEGGRVASHLLPIGALAEYDQPLVGLG